MGVRLLKEINTNVKPVGSSLPQLITYLHGQSSTKLVCCLSWQVYPTAAAATADHRMLLHPPGPLSTSVAMS